jgi:hypothetical protein
VPPRKLPPGLVVAVPLGDGFFGYGRTLRSPYAEFFDLRTTDADRPSSLEIAAGPVLFRTIVMQDVFRRSEWQRLEVVPLTEPETHRIHRFFKQDPLNDELSIYWEDPVTVPPTEHEIPATFEQIRGMERAAVWSAVHIEARLRDHFAGVPNKFLLPPRRP